MRIRQGRSLRDHRRNRRNDKSVVRDHWDMVVDHVRGRRRACRKTGEVQPGVEQALVEGEDHSLAGLELAVKMDNHRLLRGQQFRAQLEADTVELGADAGKLGNCTKRGSVVSKGCELTKD